jgi:hypothetical protein
MRGDSVRDFYAKTLALLGLGVLAGTGALVDYWPAPSVHLPIAEPALRMPEVAWTALPASPVEPMLVATPRSVVARGPSLQPIVADISSPALAEPLPTLSVTEPAVFAYRSVALAAPPPDVLVPVTWASTGHTEIALSSYDDYQPIGSGGGYPSGQVALDSSADQDDWWITAAAKRTGSSIARTGARTGASFVNLFRAVNRVVRRALPN